MKMFALLIFFILQGNLLCEVSRGPSGTAAPSRAVAPRITSIAFVAPQSKAKRRASDPLLRWRESLQGTRLAPANFDVVCAVQSPSGPPNDYAALTTMDFIVAPTVGRRAEDWTQLAREVSWGQVTEMDDLRMILLKGFGGGEVREIRFSGYNLRPVLKAFAEPGDGLWPWALRVRVVLVDRALTRVAEDEAILPLIPIGKRLEN